jgi:ribonuclease HI
MELMGAIVGLEYVIKNKLSDTVKLYSDSAYVLGGIESWLKNWKKNGWKTANKKPVLNQELWQELDEKISQLKKVECIKVKGHAGVVLNERADFLATMYADGMELTLYHGDKDTYKKILKNFESK